MRSETMTAMTQRRLAGSEVGLAVGLSIAAVLFVLAGLGYFLYQGRKSEESPVELETKEEVNVEDPVEEVPKEEAPIELQPTESSNDSYESVAGTYRTGMLNSLDVHACASNSCEICRHDKEPNFVGATKFPEGTEGHIRALPNRWWEKNIDKDKMKAILTQSWVHSNGADTSKDIRSNESTSNRSEEDGNDEEDGEGMK